MPVGARRRVRQRLSATPGHDIQLSGGALARHWLSQTPSIAPCAASLTRQQASVCEWICWWMPLKHDHGRHSHAESVPTGPLRAVATRVSVCLQSAPFLTVGVAVEDNTVARSFSDNDMALISYVRQSVMTVV